MKKMIFLLLLMNACSFPQDMRENSTDWLLQSARNQIFTYGNVPLAKKYLQIALEEHNSAQAANLLVRLELQGLEKNNVNWHSKKVQKLRQNALALVGPFISSNPQSAFLAGLLNYEINNDQALKNFELGANANLPVAMLYTGLLFHHHKKDNDKALHYFLKAAHAGCARAGAFAQALIDPVYSDGGQALDLSVLQAQAKGVWGLETLAEYVEDLSAEEASYLRREVHKQKEEHRHQDSLLTYHLNQACRFN
ncbi:hypothetical protein MTBPR1_100034 [Candidatus Terasakiella magnetica]|uniref:Sel1 repeat family protein n=1 Tax=Candidatus Terasakiella magnetica TaxID=1867952 RepID=A0A1C3RDM0_9PROT|nr:hypothetical protein [Candidatus Terasakiella magnetica]SCA55393.1 hypothetical protein MTBPR1_100034 [Candidatus Terasakiella magnetica]